MNTVDMRFLKPDSMAEATEDCAVCTESCKLSILLSILVEMDERFILAFFYCYR